MGMGLNKQNYGSSYSLLSKLFLIIFLAKQALINLILYKSKAYDISAYGLS